MKTPTVKRTLRISKTTFPDTRPSFNEVFTNLRNELMKGYPKKVA